MLCTSNDEARQEFSILLHGQATGGTPTPQLRDHTSPLDPADTAGQSQMNATMRHRIDHYLEPGTTLYFG